MVDLGVFLVDPDRHALRCGSGRGQQAPDGEQTIFRNKILFTTIFMDHEDLQSPNSQIRIAKNLQCRRSHFLPPPLEVQLLHHYVNGVSGPS